jgi:nicotinate-nucleotide pyrophosphorylase (carboxylating)
MSVQSMIEQLADMGLPADRVVTLVRDTIAEDLDGGVDVTTVATVPAHHESQLDLVVREDGIAAGIPIAALVFEVVAENAGHPIHVTQVGSDAASVKPGEVLLSARGRTRDLLTGERTALNLLCHLSGVATATNEWALALRPGNTKVRDTRKTMPGLLRWLRTTT